MSLAPLYKPLHFLQRSVFIAKNLPPVPKIVSKELKKSGVVQCYTFKFRVIFFKLSPFQDVSNFDQFPRDIGVPADETSGWDADF